MMKSIIFSILFFFFASSSFAQPTHTVTDDERLYKDAKDLFVKEQYALAYPMMQELLQRYPQNTLSTRTYILDDVNYYFIVCRLKLMQEVAAEDAEQYINSVNNEPRRQLMSFHLAHYYFLENKFEKSVQYYELAGYDNISNEQLADAKFERAYAYFNMKQFQNALPLFEEIIQIPSNKYFIPANYYYGFISYNNKKYDAALKSFKVVETIDPYQAVVPYYISEIYYFQGKKDEALKYGEVVLGRGGSLYYDNQLKLLTGQLYFEKKDYKKALPLLEDYVNSADKVSKEILYELSYSHYMEGNNEKAIEGFKQLSNERDSMGQNSMYLLGDLYLKAGNKSNARNAFQYSAFNSSNPTQQKVSRFNYAKLSYELGYQDIALNEMRRYIDDYPGSEYDAEAKEILISMLAQTNNFREAMTVYESFTSPTVAMQRVYPKILYGRAIEFINDQQLARADELLLEVIANQYSGSTKAYANFWRGEIAFRQQRYTEAVRQLNQFLQANVPGQGEATPAAAKYNLGYSHLYLENYRQALENFTSVASRLGNSSTAIEQDAYLRGGDAHYMLRDYAKATAVYDQFINSAMPQADYATFQKSMIAGISSSNEKIRLLNRIPVQYPSSSLVQEANMEIALTYIADEKFREAIPYLEKILSSNDQSIKPRAYLKLGLAYYNLNNNNEALRTYTKLIETYPRSVEAEEALSSARDIYVEESRSGDYIALMKKAGREVSVSEADSLSFAAASLKYNNGNCTGAIPGLSEYISTYQSGNYVLDAYYMRSDCYLKQKDFTNGLKDLTYISGRGFSRYYEYATLEAARLYYFELKDYTNSKKYFSELHKNASTEENRLEALRGLIRTYYQLKDYSQANTASKELLEKKGLNTDDRSVANLVLGKSLQQNGDCPGAIDAFKAVASINRSAWGAEARYEIAKCYLTLNNLSAAEKAANAVIKETGSYDFWVTSSYILLGDVFMSQKDYFNAKATYESVAENAMIPELKAEARQKFEKAVSEEKQGSKISN